MRAWLKYSSIAAIILMTCGAAHAQDDLQLNIGDNVNIPTGGFKNYVTNPAYKGFTAGPAFPLGSPLSLGLNVGYNDLYQKYPRTQYSDGHGSSISAVVSNSIQMVPLTFSAD